MNSGRRLFSPDSLLFFLFLLTGCATLGSPGSGLKVEGLVSRDSKSFPGALVSIYRVNDYSEGNSPVSTVTADDKGRFVLYVGPGDYIVTARASGFFAYFGRNPVHVNADHGGLSLPMAPSHVPKSVPVPEGAESVEGRVLLAGNPLEGAIVRAYLNARTGFKGQAYAQSAPTGPDGSYSIPLEPGSYFITAKVRADGHRTGPLNPGDLFGALEEAPLRVPKASKSVVDLELLKLPGAEMMARYRSGFAYITGIVRDEKGKPLAGFRPCLYNNSKMLDEPLAVGEVTGPDGRFEIRTDRAGRFWLGARERLGGPPKSGERMGHLKGEPTEGLSIGPGTAINDATVVVRPVP